MRWSPRLERLESRLLLHGDGEPEHALTDHIHAQLDIFIEGVHEVIPASIGVDSTGIIDVLHTHEAGGRLHQHPIGAAGEIVPGDFLTVGDFFDTWRTNAGDAGNNSDAVFNANNILGNTVNATQTIRMFVNGVLNDEFENYEFHDGDSIVISYEAVTNAQTVTVVNVNTSQGVIPIELFNVAAPLTVANFLNYVNDGDYVDSLVHRSVPNFIIQFGGFTFDGSDFARVPADPAVMNEPGISNTLGTIAMAKLGGDPNSATNQWFVNLNDNSGNLDAQNGGFTVFGRVIGDGMEVANAIAALPIENLRNIVNPAVSSAFGETPVVNYNGPPITANELVVINSVTVVTSGIEGTKFDDANGNGMREAGENGLEGWTIYLDTNDNGALDAGETMAVTDADGRYAFDQLNPGTYIVREVLQTGWVQTAPASGFHSVTIGGDDGATDVDFGNVQVTAPTDLLLLPTSDTGASSSDGLTQLNNDPTAQLQFSLAGLIPGATVTLVDTTGGETVIAEVTADSTSMMITTNGTATLANGQHSIVARQSFGGTTSGDSDPFDLAIDATPPVFGSTPITQTAAGTPYEYNADTDDEVGAGVNYDLSQAVTGVTIDAVTGLVSWTPTIAQVGMHDITVRAIDRAGNLSMQAFTVEVTNSPPVLDAIADQTVDERATVTFTATATDANPGDMLTFSLDVDAPAGATIDPNTGEFSWTTTEENGPGMFPITVRVTDQGGEEDSQQFMVTVNELNDVPTVEPIADRVAIVDMALSFFVMATDPDLPAQTLTFSLVGAPAGAAIDSDTGEFTWTPTAGDSPGTYMMEVRVSDGDMEAGQAFTVYVQDTAVAPVLQSIGDQTVDEGTQLLVNILARDGNLPDDAHLFSLDAGAPDGAAIDPVTGVFTWTPDEVDGPGMFQVTVRVTDASGLEDTTTFNITVDEVNLPPVIGQIDNFTVEEGDELSFAVGVTDPDLPVNTLAFSFVSSDAATASIDPDTGQFTWTTTEDDGPGIFSFTVQVSDGQETDTATFTVTVEEVNQPPVLALIGPQMADEGGTVSFSAAATDADRPENTLSFSLGENAPAAASIDSVTGEFTWLTDEADGPNTFMVIVIVSDGAGGEDSQQVTITVNEINTPPVLQPIDDETIPEGQLFTFTAVATDADLPENDLTFTLDTGAPLGISLDAQTGVFSWTPTEAQGPDSYTITIRVDDGPNSNDSQTFTLTVTEVDSPPVLDPIGDQAVDVGGTVTFTATASDTDIPVNDLTFSLDAGAPDGATIDPDTGEFTWTPSQQQGTGFFDVTVRVTDDTGLSDTESIEILVNTPPVIDAIGDRQVDEGSLLSFTVTAEDDDDVTFRLGDDAPAGATIDPVTGLFTWTPSESQGPGTFEITVIAEDTGGLESEETFEVTVDEDNQPPVIDPIGDQLGMPGTEMQFTVTASDPDLPANNLRFSLDPGSPPEAMINQTTGLFWWTIPPDITDTRVTFTVRVTDDGPGGLSTTQSFDVLLTNIGFSLFSSDGAAGLNDTSQVETIPQDDATAAADDTATQTSAGLGLPLVPAGDDSLIDSGGSNFAVGPDTGVPHFWQTERDGPMPGGGSDGEEDDNRVGDSRGDGGAVPQQAALPADEELTLLRVSDNETIDAIAGSSAAPPAALVDHISDLLGRHESDAEDTAFPSADMVPTRIPAGRARDDSAEPAAKERAERPRLAAAALAPLLAGGLRPMEDFRQRDAPRQTSYLASWWKRALNRLTAR